MVNEKPNIIVFFTDQQRHDTTGIHGNPLDLTPNFDQMAQQGTDVHYSFTCQPLCCPARASLQTGLYATQTGCYRNDIALSPESRTLAHEFRDNDYTTAYIGKWHLASHDYSGAVPEIYRGAYEYWLASNLLEIVSDSYKTVLYDNDNRAVQLPGYRTDALTDAAIRYIDNHKSEPFFLFLSFLEPHQQNNLDNYPAPRAYPARYRGRWTPPDLAALGGSTQQHLWGYYGMVKRLDEALGRLLDALFSLDILENTVVLYTSDHGNHFKTRNNEYKRSCHEASIRIPTAIQGPGFDSGGRIRKLVSLVDLPPTLLDAAGIPIPDYMEGHSILPLVRNPQHEWSDDVFIQISESETGRAIRTERWKYGVTSPIAEEGELASSESYSEAYLYDLQADPYELHNLVGLASHQEISQLLRQRLIKRIQTIEKMTPTIKPSPYVAL